MQKEVLADQGKRLMSAYMPQKFFGQVMKVLGILYKNFSKFISSQCLEAVILGALFVLSMTIFRLPYALLVGSLIAVTALIPIVGAFVGCFVGAFLILVENPISALVFVILFLIVQQLEGNLIYPKVVGSSVGLPAIWVLVAVSVGGSLFGVVGVLVFIPITSTVYTLLREDVNERNSKKTGLTAKCKEESDGKTECESAQDK
jgi:predicted PurR-regulated permease PerM